MLAYYYPPRFDPNLGRRIEVLAAVLDSAFVQISEHTGILTEMVMLEQQLRSQVAVAPAISYHREPPKVSVMTRLAEVLQSEGRVHGVE